MNQALFTTYFWIWGALGAISLLLHGLGSPEFRRRWERKWNVFTAVVILGMLFVLCWPMFSAAYR